MERKEMLKQLDQMKSKLMGAVAMLLVAAILMGSTSYAWFVLSTAPEVANLKTTAGANGVLEIALPGTVTDENGMKRPNEPKSKVGASSANIMQPVEEANLYWGNLVDITDSYGLQNLVLFPSRLNLSQSLTNTVEMASPLVVPSYGTDGRIASTTTVSKAVFNKAEDQYNTTSDYGVHLLGLFADGESSTEDEVTTYTRQEVVEQMANSMDTARESLRSDMAGMLERHSAGIMNILLELEFTSNADLGPLKIDSYSDDSVREMGEIIEDMGKIADGALDSLRYAVMAKAAADTVHYPNDEDGQAALSAMYTGLAEMSTDQMQAIITANSYTDLSASITAISAAKNNINHARYLWENTKNNGNNNLTNVATALFDVNSTDIAGNMGLGLFDGLAMLIFDAYEVDENGAPVLDDAGQPVMKTLHATDMSMWSNATAPENSSPFAALATIIGDYRGLITDNVDFQNVMIKTGPVILSQETNEDTGVTTTTYVKIDYETGSEVQTTDINEAVQYPEYYAFALSPFAARYQIDLFVTGQTAKAYAPETNTGELKAISEAVSAVTVEGSFTVSDTVTDLKTAYGYSVDFALRASKSGDLLLQQEAVDRVTGEAADGSATAGSGSSLIINTAASDLADVAALVENIYVVFMSTTNGSIYGVATPDPTRATVNADTTTSVPLVLRNANILEDGSIRAGSERSSLLTMTADTTYYITALVYLNGDMVSNAMVSATQGMSLVGTVNLQFASSAALEPMGYSFN